MTKDHENFQPVIYDALRGDEESRRVVEYLYGVGAHTTSRPGLPSMVDAWKILEQAQRIVATCEAGISNDILRACDPDAVNKAKALMNAADEEIPGALEELRATLISALDITRGSVTFDAVWNLRNEPTARLQILATLAGHIR